MFNMSSKKFDSDDEPTPLQKLGQFIHENIDLDDGAFLRDFDDDDEEGYTLDELRAMGIVDEEGWTPEERKAFEAKKSKKS